MRNLNELGVQEMSAQEVRSENGGSTCPTYDNSVNYGAAEDGGAFIVGLIKGFFGF